jgi:hypothetical protein
MSSGFLFTNNHLLAVKIPSIILSIVLCLSLAFINKSLLKIKLSLFQLYLSLLLILGYGNLVEWVSILFTLQPYFFCHISYNLSKKILETTFIPILFLAFFQYQGYNLYSYFLFCFHYYLLVNENKLIN